MANYVTLQNPGINSGTAVNLLNGEFTYGWNNLITADPSNSTYGNVEVQFSGWDNPLISLMFYIPVNNTPAGTITWSLWNQFAKNQYDGTSATKTSLYIVVGSADTSLLDYSASSSTTGVNAIPVQVKSYTLTFSPGDSNRASMWRIQAQLQVTK